MAESILSQFVVMTTFTLDGVEQNYKGQFTAASSGQAIEAARRFVITYFRPQRVIGGAILPPGAA
jgi:hypothetical protein